MANKYASVTGAGTHDGSTTGNAWTLLEAAVAAVAGDVVYFADGTYTDQLVPAHSGTLVGGYITFIATNRRGAVISGGAGAVGIDLTDKNYIHIEHFEIKGWGWEKIYFSNSDHLQIVDNYIHGTDTYVHGTGGDTCIHGAGSTNTNILIQDNELCFVNGRGVHLSGDNITIKGNTIYANDNDGIFGGGDGWFIENNLIYEGLNLEGLHQDGIDLDNFTNSIIRYNRIFDYTQLIYFHLKDAIDLSIQNVKIYGNVLFNDRYKTQEGGDCPGIFIDASALTGHTIEDVEIHSNTFGSMGGANGSIQIYTDTELSGNSIAGIKIYNNIFYERGINFTEGDEAAYTSDYNFFVTGVTKPSFEGAHSITGAIHFTDYVVGDSDHLVFTLASNSGAINAGNPSLTSVVTLPTPWVDIAGNNRGIVSDIGAYEYLYALTCTAGAHGTVSPTSESVPDGDYQFVAVPASDYIVDEWKEGATVLQTGGNTFLLEDVVAAHDLTVSFKSDAPPPETFYVVTASAGTHGTVSPDGETSVLSGDNLVLTATPAAGYVVDKWTLDSVEVQTGGSVFNLSTVVAIHTVSVTFKLQGSESGTACIYNTQPSSIYNTNTDSIYVEPNGSVF